MRKAAWQGKTETHIRAWSASGGYEEGAKVLDEDGEDGKVSEDGEDGKVGEDGDDG